MQGDRPPEYDRLLYYQRGHSSTPRTAGIFVSTQFAPLLEHFVKVFGLSSTGKTHEFSIKNAIHLIISTIEPFGFDFKSLTSSILVYANSPCR